MSQTQVTHRSLLPTRGAHDRPRLKVELRPSAFGSDDSTLGGVAWVNLARDGSCTLLLDPASEIDEAMGVDVGDVGSYYLLTDPDGTQWAIRPPASVTPVSSKSCLVEVPTIDTPVRVGVTQLELDGQLDGYAEASAFDPAATQTSVLRRLYVEGTNVRVGDNLTAIKDLPRFIRSKELIVSVTDAPFLADPSGVTDSTTAIDAASAFARSKSATLYFPPGSFIYNGAGLYGHPVRGAGRTASVVTLGAGVALLVSPPTGAGGAPAPTLSLQISDIQTVGGFGMVRLTYTGIQSGDASKRAERVKITSCTGSGVSSLASDDPYWTIDADVSGATDAAMGVALAGLMDGSDIRVRGRKLGVLVKLGRGGTNARVTGSLVRGVAAGIVTRVDIWLVPSNTTTSSGGGCTIHKYRFGNENFVSGSPTTAGDMRVVYAEEDAGSGADFASRRPDLVTVSPNFIGGHRIVDAVVYGNGASPSTSLVYSTTPNVSSCSYAGTIGSVPFKYVIEFAPGAVPGPDYTTQGNLSGPWATGNLTSSQLYPQLSNGLGAVVAAADARHVFVDRDATAPWHLVTGSDVTEFVPLIGSTATAASLAKTQVPDAVNGADAYEFTYSGGTTSPFYTLDHTKMKVGIPTWIEFDLAPGSVAPSAVDLLVQVRDSVNTSIVHAFRPYPVRSGWSRYRMLWVPRSLPADPQVRFLQDITANCVVRIGRVRVYQGREPVNYDAVTASAAGPSSKFVPYGPADQGWKLWTGDPNATSTVYQLLAGYVYTTRLQVPAAGALISAVITEIQTTAGAGLANAFVGFYQGGNLLGASADQSAAWQAIGVKSSPLVAPFTAAPGDLLLAVMVGAGTTLPSLLSGRATNLVNYGAPSPRWARSTANGFSALPATAPDSAAITGPWWAAAA